MSNWCTSIPVSFKRADIRPGVPTATPILVLLRCSACSDSFECRAKSYEGPNQQMFDSGDGEALNAAFFLTEEIAYLAYFSTLLPFERTNRPCEIRNTVGVAGQDNACRSSVVLRRLPDTRCEGRSNYRRKIQP